MKHPKLFSAVFFFLTIICVVMQGTCDSWLWTSAIILSALAGFIFAVNAWKKNKKDIAALCLMIGNALLGFGYTVYFVLVLLILLGLHIQVLDF